MDYYTKHSKDYVEATINCDMSEQYKLFQKYLPNNSKRILDLGFGSGRDSLYFKSKGYEVTSIDSNTEFCQHAKELGLDDIKCMSAQEIDYNEEFDGIWACASLLHVPSNELNDVFKRCYKALKKDRIIYCSFKYGKFEGIRDERYYIDLTEETINEYLMDTGFKVLEIRITNDVRKDKNDKWINAIFKK